MQRNLPPYPALRAFEAAARLGSFRAAGEELCVTRSAISHQIRNLETYLGMELFERTPLGPRISGTGLEYQQRVTLILDSLEAETKALFSLDNPTVIRVRGTPAFLARWLIPRLSRIQADTGLEVRMSGGLPPTDFSTGDVDVIFHWGSEPVPGAVVEPFLATPKIVVAASDYVDANGPLRSPRDLAKCCLLRDEIDDLWEEWFRAAGVEGVVTASGPIMPHCEMVLAAVERAQGIAIAYEALVLDDLATGRLVKLFPDRTEDKLIYSFAYLNENAGAIIPH